MPENRSPRRRFKKNVRQQEPGRRHKRWPLVLAALSLIFAAAATYSLLQSSLLTVHTVRVEGAETLDTEALVGISGLQGADMLDLPLARARDSLLALPQVKSVSFQRNWPNQVVLRVVERLPFAFWTVGGRDYVVDQEGYVLAAGAPSGPAPHVYEPNSNRVMGPGDRVHPDALALADRIFRESPNFIGQKVSRLEYSPDVGVTALFEGGMRVTFGDERAYAYKVAVLSELLNKLQATGTRPHDVDLRFGERVTYD